MASDHHHHDRGTDGPGYATPQVAIEQSAPEDIAYVIGPYVGTDVDAPDFVAVVDLDRDSATYQEIIERIEMPNRGDEPHHFGWNACSSSCHVDGLQRQHLVIPGNRSGRIHVVDTENRRHPELVTGSRAVSGIGRGNHAELTFGAISIHRLFEGVILSTLCGTGAAVGLLGAVVLTGYTALETAVIGGLYATAPGRPRVVGAITLVQVSYVVGAAIGLGVASAVPVSVRTLALAVVGGVLLIVGATHTEFATRSVSTPP